MLSSQDHVASRSHMPHVNKVLICKPSKKGNASMQACVRLGTHNLLYKPHSRESIITTKMDIPIKHGQCEREVQANMWLYQQLYAL